MFDVVELLVIVHGPSPPAGTVRKLPGDGEHLAFSGWLELLGALEALVAPASDAPPNELGGELDARGDAELDEDV